MDDIIDQYADELVYETTFGCDVPEEDAVQDARSFVARVHEALLQDAAGDVGVLARRISDLRGSLRRAEEEVGTLLAALAQSEAAREVLERKCKSSSDKLAAVRDTLAVEDRLEEAPYVADTVVYTPEPVCRFTAAPEPRSVAGTIVLPRLVQVAGSSK